MVDDHSNIAMSIQPLEVWRPVVGYEGRYEVSNIGRVRAIFPSTNHLPVRLLKPWLSTWGHYLTVALTRHDGHKQKFSIHRLVFAAFHGPIPPGKFICHKDGGKYHNTPENLYAGTQRENMADAMRHGTFKTGERRSQAKLTPDAVIEARALRVQGRSYWSIARQFGVDYNTIYKAIGKATWKHVATDVGGTV